MNFRSGRSGTRSTQFDQKEETIILRSCDEKKGLSGERDHAGNCSGSKKARETTDAMD